MGFNNGHNGFHKFVYFQKTDQIERDDKCYLNELKNVDRMDDA